MALNCKGTKLHKDDILKNAIILSDLFCNIFSLRILIRNMKKEDIYWKNKKININKTISVMDLRQ
jgi:hypothetical protein